MRDPKSATVVLPAYGVGDAVGSVVRDLAVAAYALRSRGIDLDVLLLHTEHDQTARIATAAAARYGLTLTTAAGPEQPGAAWLAGFRSVLAEGRADLVITMDADGRHDAAQIPHLVDALTERDLDVVIGSRWARGSGTPGLGLGRWAIGRLANLAFRTLNGTRDVHDATTSFRVARVEVVRAFDLDRTEANRYVVQTSFVAMAMARGYRVGEAPIIYWPPARPPRQMRGQKQRQEQGRVNGRPRLPGRGVEGEVSRPKGGGDRGRDVRDFAKHLLALRGQVRATRRARLSAPGSSFTDEHFGAADDLERLGTAEAFFNWVLDEFDPYLTGSVLEVGAGTGTITRKLAERYPDLHVVALEPARNVFRDLASFAAITPNVTALRQTLAEMGEPQGEGFDAVFYLNVLEHIADDAGELVAAANTLRPGGALLVFGPALPWLYSELDYKAGHYRRYSVDGLRKLVEQAGLRVVTARYFDALGVLPYWVVYRLLRRDSISGTSMWGYDRVIVPVSRLLQRAAPARLAGKNVILVARKPDAAKATASAETRARDAGDAGHGAD
jgi:SAM-dependent methyltransferase